MKEDSQSPATAEDLVATVRDRHGRIAATGSSCCSPSAGGGCSTSPAGLSVGLG